SDQPAVRYWAAMGLLMRDGDGIDAGQAELRALLADKSPAVQIVAAEALVRFGDERDRGPAVARLLEWGSPEKSGAVVSIAGLNALDAVVPMLGAHAAALRD